MGQKLTFKNNKNSLTIHLSNGTFGTLYPESAKPIDNDDNHEFSESLKSIWNIGTKIHGEEQDEYFYQLDLSSLNSGKDQKIKFSLIKDQKDDEDFDDEFKELLTCEIEGEATIFQPSAGGFAAKKITATNDFDTDLFKTQLEADDFCKEKLFVEENHSFIFSYIQNENVLKILGSKNLDMLIFTKK